MKRLFAAVVLVPLFFVIIIGATCHAISTLLLPLADRMLRYADRLSGGGSK